MVYGDLVQENEPSGNVYFFNFFSDFTKNVHTIPFLYIFQCAYYHKTSCHRRLKCEREVISRILKVVEERMNYVQFNPLLVKLIETCGVTPVAIKNLK